MDISRTEQRVLHLLAQGGRIEIEKNDKKRIASVKCLTRDGWHYTGVDLELFRKLKRKKAISSSDGGPYGVTKCGLELVRSELDNR
ncbi:YjhX family toxin [Mesorhizobium sp.]|uniref:YjhX family toxin n=1 Tax=Mesorhizobium sp. TaxID=1871066 RepID=UPI003BABC030